MALVKFELIQELRGAAEAFVKAEVHRVTGKVPEGEGHAVFTPDNLAIVTGAPRIDQKAESRVAAEQHSSGAM